MKLEIEIIIVLLSGPPPKEKKKTIMIALEGKRNECQSYLWNVHLFNDNLVSTLCNSSL